MPGELLASGRAADVFDAGAARQRLATAARLRLDTDPHLLDRERAALKQMIASATVDAT